MPFPPYKFSSRGRSCARSRILARVDCAISEHTDPNSASGLTALPDTHSAREPRSHVPGRGSFADSDHTSDFDPKLSPQRVRSNSVPLVSSAPDHTEYHVIAPLHLRAISPWRAANIHDVTISVARALIPSHAPTADPLYVTNRVPGLEPKRTLLPPFATVVSYETYRLRDKRTILAANENLELHRIKRQLEGLIPTLKPFNGTQQTRQAFSVVPSDYWQLNCWKCRDCGHSTFTCLTLTSNQRMYFAYLYDLDQIKGNRTMAQFLEQKTERRVQLAKERAEYDGKHPGDEQRPQSTSEYPRRDDNRPQTVAHRPDERYSRPYDKNQRGSYGSRGGFRGGSGRRRNAHFGDRRGVYVTGTVEDERENGMTSTPQHESDPEQEPEPPQPAWLQRRRKRIFIKRLTAVRPQPRELSQPAGCTNTTWKEEQFPSLRHRDSNHGRRRIRRTSGPMTRTVGGFPAQPGTPNEPMDPDVIYGPCTRYPRRVDDLVCVLTATHYVVSCSVGPDPRNLRPFSAVFDTASGPNLIRESAFFDGWERYLVRNEVVPRFGDENGRPLRLLGVALIRARFGDSLLYMPFGVADYLAVDVIVGTRFIKQHIDAIECRRQCVKLHRGCVLPILDRNHDGTFAKTDRVSKRRDQNETNELENQPKTPGSNMFNQAQTVRLTKNTTIPPMGRTSRVNLGWPRVPRAESTDPTTTQSPDRERRCRHQDQRTICNYDFQLLENPEMPSERYRSRVCETKPTGHTRTPR